MKVIVGLGNPGGEYEQTRHNIGYMVVDKLSRELGSGVPKWEQQEKFRAFIANIGGVLLVKPITFMNNSGESVQKITSFYKISHSDIWVVHDDIDLPIGKIKIRERGGTAGHNGLESIVKHIGTDEFVRFRLGIGRGKEAITKNTDQQLRHRSVIDFVLSKFTQHEAGELRKLIKYGTEAVQMALTEGLDKAMNRFN